MKLFARTTVISLLAFTVNCEIQFQPRDHPVVIGQNLCSLPPETGRCRAAFREWYYDPIDQDCKLFIYGGCGGNQNRFETKEECLFRCPIDCSLAPDTGPCNDMQKRYFFDLLLGHCREFTYGGCGGNQNKFSKLSDCQSRCRISQKKEIAQKSELIQASIASEELDKH